MAYMLLTEKHHEQDLTNFIWKPTQVARHGSLMSSALKQSNKSIIYIAYDSQRMTGSLVDFHTGVGWQIRLHTHRTRGTIETPFMWYCTISYIVVLTRYLSTCLLFFVPQRGVVWLDVRSGENWSSVWLFSHLQWCSLPQVGKWPERCQVVG